MLLSCLRHEIISLNASVSPLQELVTSGSINRSKSHFGSCPTPSALVVLKSYRFMQSVSLETRRELEKTAREKGTTVQELLRAIIIPEWFRGRSQKLASNEEYFHQA